MVVPLFGWSAGDLVTSIKILHSIAGAFKEASGASSQYKETASWLESFASDLERMKEYITENPDARYTKNIVEQVGRIDRYYGEFETYLQKYDKGLSSTAGSNAITATTKKVKWALQELKGKVDSLKFAVTGPIVSLNLLLALQCRIDLSAVADKVIGMPPTPKISDIETAFSGLHDRIHMLEEVQERMRANLSDESAIIRDEMRHCISETSANILSSHCDATAQIVSIIEDRDAAWDRSLSIMRRHLENIEETQSRTQKFYKELRNQQLALDTVELLLMNNDNLANSVKELHSELAALASTPPKTTLLDMVQTAGDVTNVAITVGIFIAVAMQTIDRVRKRADHQEPTHGYSHGISDMIQFDYFYNLPSYPFELAWKSREQDQGIRWDPAARAWGVVVPDQILMMLDVTFGQKPASGITKNYFLPEEGIHADVLGADASLYLGQRVWLGFKSNMGIDGYLIRAFCCFTEEMINNLKQDSAKWMAFLDAYKCRYKPNFYDCTRLQYTDSNIFKARWKPLRAAIQQKLTQDAEKLSKCKRNDDELSTKWVSSFQAASGGGGHDGEIEPLPSIGFEQPESKKETEEEKLRRKRWELDEIKRLSQYYRWGPDRSSARPPPTFAIPIKSKLEIDTTEWLHSRGPWKSDYANRQNHVYTTSTSDEYAMVSESPSGENSSPNTVPTVEHHHLQSDRYPLVYTYPADEFYRLPWASTNPNYSEPWTRPPPFPPHFSPNSWGHSFGPPPKFELPF